MSSVLCWNESLCRLLLAYQFSIQRRFGFSDTNGTTEKKGSSAHSHRADETPSIEEEAKFLFLQGVAAEQHSQLADGIIFTYSKPPFVCFRKSMRALFDAYVCCETLMYGCFCSDTLLQTSHSVGTGYRIPNWWLQAHVAGAKRCVQGVVLMYV